MKKILIPLAAAMLLSGCNDNATPINADNLMHHRYELTEVNNQSVSYERMPYIEFGENMTINGRMCNTFFGKFELNNNTLKSSDLASTRMLCADKQLNQLDQQIGDMLNKGVSVSLKDHTLTLSRDKQKLTYQLKDLVN